MVRKDSIDFVGKTVIFCLTIFRTRVLLASDMEVSFMATAKIIQMSAADSAFDRVRPLLDQLRNDIRAAADAVAKEYDALPAEHKKDFADMVQQRYGWSHSRLSTFAVIGRRAPKKLQVIRNAAPRSEVDASNTELLHELSKTDDSVLRGAAGAGMFDRPVSARDVHRLRTKGMLPSEPSKRPSAKTDLDRIKASMVKADNYINRASLEISNITSIMYDAGITDAKGREATALIKSFEKLCTKIATANPATSKRAFQILRGEV